MGNQLVAFAPSLIRPVEHYLTDIPEYVFDSNLGSTRFLKVCRVKHGQLLCVVKVFVIHEREQPGLPPPIQIYCERLNSLKNSLSSSPSQNCLPFTTTRLTERSVIAIRPYVKYSLYDRMSTRPFIQWPEKLWIAFQLLCALIQVHKHGLCHGDLKLENILITPGLRLLICDFAPFKPIYLPRNNPSAIFGFFFDTAGRRVCYVAPERFHDDKSRLGDNLLMQEDELRHFLVSSMDIFSAGCCLIELFTEGRVPFDLSQLLAFCSGEYYPSHVIEQIEDPFARELVTDMIQIDPNLRLSAEEYLVKYRGKLFPEVLYSTLQSYFDLLAFQPLTTTDSRMSRLYSDIKNLPDNHSLSLIFTSLVTAELRGCQTTSAKHYALDAFNILSNKLNDAEILERVVPYIVFLLNDLNGSPRVRAKALESLVNCLDTVKEIPSSDYNIFSGYIFPALERLDRDISVRISLATNIARIAKISMRYLEASYLHEPENLNLQQPQFLTEFHSQKDTIANLLAGILTESNPIVKRVLVSTPGNLETLCMYFGRVKAHDLILSHLITFLNDKEDAELRQAFFKCVTGVAAFIGWHSAPLIIPLLKQGLSDVEEFVMREALIAIKCLAEINFFGRRFLFDLLEEVLPFTIHPNLWLRIACAGVLTSFKQNLPQVDVYCHVIPRLKMYLKPSSNSIWGINEISIMSKVRDPLERQVYESCCRAKESLLQSLIEFLRTHDGKGQPKNNDIANFLTRLRAEGLPINLDLVYILFLQRHIIKVNTQRSLRQAISPTFSGRSSGAITQQQFQSHLLTLSTLPLKEISYTLNNNNSNQPSLQSGIDNFNSMNIQQIGRNNNQNNAQQINFTDKPKGNLVAHLHEHRGPIIRICPFSAFKGIFATGTREEVRIWDAEKMEGKNIANRSRCIIKLPGDKNITNLANGAASNQIGITDDSLITLYALENMNARQFYTSSINPASGEMTNGMPVDLISYSPNLYIVGTELGKLFGYDIRYGGKAFTLQSDLKWGLMTSLASDSDRNWICTGTSKGILTCWDLRFGISVNTIKTDVTIRRIKPSPFHPWGIFTSSRGLNEVSLWNLETGSRHLCLWASSQPPFGGNKGTPTPTDKSRSSHSIFGMGFVPSLNTCITGGSDMNLRWWDMNSPSDSYLLTYPEKAEQQLNGSTTRVGEFRFRLVDGVEVIQDITNTHQNQSETSSSNLGSSNTIAMGNAHHNSISDVACISTPNQSFILSSSSDGVIKVWK